MKFAGDGFALSYEYCGESVGFDTFCPPYRSEVNVTGRIFPLTRTGGDRNALRLPQLTQLKALPPMKPIFREIPLLITTLMLLCSTVVNANESAESDTGTAPGVVVKVEKSIERGTKAAANGVTRGAKAAARGIEHGAKATANGVERGAKATSNAAHAVAKKIGDAPPQSSPGK